MDKEKNIKETSEEVETYSGIGKKAFLFKRSDLKFDEDGTPIIPSDAITIRLDKDGKPLTSPEPLTVKADYSRRAFTADCWMIDDPGNTKLNTEISIDMDADSFYDIFDGGEHYNAQKLAASVMPVFSTLPFRVELPIYGKPYMIPLFFKRNTYNIGHLGIPSPEAFRFPVPSDSIVGPKNI